jgi:hypothetical protein
LINLAKLSSPTGKLSPIFSPLFGRYDIIGHLLKHLSISLSDDLDYIVKVSLYVLGYAITVLSCIAIFLLAKRLFKSSSLGWRWETSDCAGERWIVTRNRPA